MPNATFTYFSGDCEFRELPLTTLITCVSHSNSRHDGGTDEPGAAQRVPRPAHRGGAQRRHRGVPPVRDRPQGGMHLHKGGYMLELETNVRNHEEGPYKVPLLVESTY